MRSVCLVMSILLATAAGCGSDASADPNPRGDPRPGNAQSSVACPQICGTGTQCQYPDGSCREACNDCLCRAAGGKVVTSCDAGGSEICPQICGTGTQCQYPDGSCQEACNDCLCRSGGGKVVDSCNAASSSDSSQVPPELDENAGSKKIACGDNFCKQGEYCCNPSCGTCVPMGYMCTLQACE